MKMLLNIIAIILVQFLIWTGFLIALSHNKGFDGKFNIPFLFTWSVIATVLSVLLFIQTSPFLRK